MEAIPYIILAIVAVVVGIVAIIAVAVISKKRLEDAQKDLGLIPGRLYEIMTNDGSVKTGLIFSYVSYGNRSKNGNINLYFLKTSKYRGQLIRKTVMIKYQNVWKIKDIENDFYIKDDKNS